MQTSIIEKFSRTREGAEANEILRKCVHCGFCNATCPTYQLLGDELDGPRGRIYLIKQLLEGAPANAEISLHLDRCLTCRNCETTCPSGVRYSRLLEIGRHVQSSHCRRPVADRMRRRLLAAIVRRPHLFSLVVHAARMLKPVLPGSLKHKIAPRATRKIPPAKPRHPRQYAALSGCVQPVLTPQTNQAAAVVLDRLGITMIEVAGAGCCGSVDLHTTDADKARSTARQLIDQWWPMLDKGIEGFVINASGCTVAVKDYPALFADDINYYEKAQDIAKNTLDLCELVTRELDGRFRVSGAGQRVAFHAPCTLQHAQRLNGTVEAILGKVGYECVTITGSHLCCGSAGSYSLLQPDIAEQLGRQKIRHLLHTEPDIICTANVGCQNHLAALTEKPVYHWIELLLQGNPD